MGNMLSLMGTGLLETIYMTVGSTVIAYIIGLPVGLLLVASDKEGIWPHIVLNRIVGIIVNILRSVPFIILLVWVMPVTRAIVGTTIGSKATIVPLVISAAPFVARMVEGSAKEVDRGVIEATISMGASTMQIIRKVFLPEAKPSLIIGAAIAITTVLGYSAMSGIVGGGGLGAIAINYGYYRSNSQVMLLMVIILVVIVQVFQEIGGRLSNKTDKRIR